MQASTATEHQLHAHNGWHEVLLQLDLLGHPDQVLVCHISHQGICQHAGRASVAHAVDFLDQGKQRKWHGTCQHVRVGPHGSTNQYRLACQLVVYRYEGVVRGESTGRSFSVY